jgi:hypothetical protein
MSPFWSASAAVARESINCPVYQSDTGKCTWHHGFSMCQRAVVQEGKWNQWTSLRDRGLYVFQSIYSSSTCRSDYLVQFQDATGKMWTVDQRASDFTLYYPLDTTPTGNVVPPVDVRVRSVASDCRSLMATWFYTYTNSTKC